MKKYTFMIINEKKVIAEDLDQAIKILEEKRLIENGSSFKITKQEEL